MSAEHRRPAVAFVVLAILAAGVVGIHRAEAQAGRLIAAVIGAGASVHGTLPQAEPLAASGLGGAGLVADGRLLALSEVTQAPTKPTSVPAAATVWTGPAPRSDGTASVPTRRGRADRARTTGSRDAGERQAAKVENRSPTAQRRSPARAVPEVAVAAASARGAGTVAASSSRADHTSPRRVDRAAHRAFHRASHRAPHRAVHRSSHRKAVRR